MKNRLIDLIKNLKEKIFNFANHLNRVIISWIKKKSSESKSNNEKLEIILQILTLASKIFCAFIILFFGALELILEIAFEIFYIITGSFLFNVTFSFLIIMLLLIILFKVAPHTAFVSFSGNSNITNFSTSADSINVLCTGENVNTITTNDKSEIELSNCQVKNNTQIYDSSIYPLTLKGSFQLSTVNPKDSGSKEDLDNANDQSFIDTLILTSSENSTMMSTENDIKKIILDGLKTDTKENTSSLLDEYIENYLFEKASDFIDSFYPNYVRGFMASNRSLSVSYSSNEKKLYIESRKTECSSSYLKVTPLNNDCYLVIFDDELEEQEVMHISKEFEIIPSLHSTSFSLSIANHCALDANNNDLVIDTQGATKIQAEVTGSLHFIYSEKPVVYELKDRIINLKSRQGDLNFNLKPATDMNKQSLECHGEISNADLSGINLFPSFGSWYRNNVYLVPLTLISTIFAGVTLMQSSRKSHALKQGAAGNGVLGKVALMIKSLEHVDVKDKDQKQQVPTIIIKIESQTPVNVTSEEKEPKNNKNTIINPEEENSISLEKGKIEDYPDEHAECAD